MRFASNLKIWIMTDRFVGPLLSIGAATFLHLASETPLRVVSPFAVLSIIHIYSAFRGGLLPGMFSALISCAYLGYSQFHGATPVTDPALVWSRIISWSWASPIMVFIVATLKAQTFRDLQAAHRHAEESARQSQFRLSKILESAPVAFWSADREGVIQYVEGHGLAATGATPDQIVGASYYDVLAYEPATLEVFRRVLSTGEPGIAENFFNDTWFETHYFAKRNASGEIIGVGGVSTDITARKRGTEERLKLEVSERSAKAESQMKSTFLANMSHEIRTPLNGVVGMTSLLLETTLTAEQRTFTDAIRSSADNLIKLVNDILDLSKAESGKVELETIDFEISQVVANIERTVVPIAGSKGLRISRSIDPELPPSFVGDPTRIGQVLANLVGNAIKFTPEGVIAIDVWPEIREGKWTSVRFEISDTGIGISEEALGRMFLPFSQADSSMTRKYGGTGLGLSISKHLVTMMGGEIGVRSEIGKGSTFWFTLPLRAGTTVARAPAKSISDRSDGRKLRVLLAEDNSVNQLIARKMIESLGHSVVVVSNGLEAIFALDEAPYDLVFMDCQMPELDGYEATRRIRAKDSAVWSGIPIVAMTANAMTGDREKCLAAGMSDYLSKPMKVADVSDAISRNVPAKTKEEEAAA